MANSPTVSGTVLLRSAAVLLVFLGLWGLVANLVESWGTISPAYWQTYLRSEVARPLLLAAAGFLLWVVGPWLGRRTG